MENVTISCSRKVEILDFLSHHNFETVKVGESVHKITREDELPVFVHNDGKNLFFEVDLGNISHLNEKDFYFELLNFNTEILPVSFAIDTTNSEDPRLILVESREIENLDDNEFLAVFDALELAAEKAEILLEKHMSSDVVI